MSSIYALSDKISRCLKTSIQVDTGISKHIRQVRSLSIHPHECLRDSRYYIRAVYYVATMLYAARTHLKPRFVHWSTVSSSVPGGVRWTIWSNILVDMVVSDNIGTYDGAIKAFGKCRRLLTIPWDWAFPALIFGGAGFLSRFKICIIIFVQFQKPKISASDRPCSPFDVKTHKYLKLGDNSHLPHEWSQLSDTINFETFDYPWEFAMSWLVGISSTYFDKRHG